MKIQKIDFVLFFVLLILIFFHVTFGPVQISFSELLTFFSGKSKEAQDYSHLIIRSRIHTVLTAIIAGIALSISGCILQSVFRNPVAGPYLLGISSGSSLAVAIMVMSVSSVGLLGLSQIVDHGIILFASWVGSLLCLFIMILISFKVKSSSGILIVGLMFSGVFSSITSVLETTTASDSLQKYVIWTLGSYKGLSILNIGLFALVTLFCLIAYILIAKSLNLLQIGDDYAQNLGSNVFKTKVRAFLISGLLAGSVTAFCGPIAFIGFGVPHVVRKLYQSSNHLVLLPRIVLMGSVLSLLSSFLASDIIPFVHLPLNAITSFLGAPYIIWVLLSDNQFKREYA